MAQAKQDLTALKQSMQKRYGKDSVLELDDTNNFLNQSGFANLPETPAADASQSIQSGTMPSTLPDQTQQETGPLGEEKSNASVIIEAMANMLKKLTL